MSRNLSIDLFFWGRAAAGVPPGGESSAERVGTCPRCLSFIHSKSRTQDQGPPRKLPAARAIVNDCGSGFEISVKFRRNSAKNFVFASYREKKFGIFRKISFENSKFKKIRPKFTEFRRNLPKFRSEISFPLNTGICNENEMVNPDPHTNLLLVCLSF